MSNNNKPCRNLAGRLAFCFVIAGFVLIVSASNAAAYSFEEQGDSVWATLLAPVVDYGVLSERIIEVKVKSQSQGITMMQTPPAYQVDEEREEFDPKPIKPPERPGIPVDPSFLDQPLVCTATVANASATSGNEDESFMVVNPANTQNIVVFSNLNANSIHRSYTTNGGGSWTHGTVATNVACCDAQAAWDSFGNLFMVYINSGLNHIYVIVSTNGGVTFGAPVQADVTGSSIDQPSIAVGNGSVWVDWNLSGNMVARGAAVTGLGAWDQFVGHAQQTIPTAAGTYGGIAVGPGANGGKVIVTYMSPSGGQGPGTIYTNTDADGLGAGGFGARVTVTATNVGGFDFIPAQSARSVDAEPGVVWDATGGTFNNRIYLVYTDEPVNESNDTDIFVRTSDTDGAFWSAPVRVNDDATVRSQFLPYIALDRTTGKVAVGFHDSRNDNGTVGAGGTNATANDDAEYWATYSANGGASWAANTRISGGWSNAAAAGASTDYGDYEGQMALNGKFYATWADNSNCDGTNPNGTAHQFDLVMGTLTIPGGSTPTSTPTFTPTSTATSTATAANTSTKTPTNTATNTATPTNTATFTPTKTPTSTSTPTFTPTNIPASTPTSTGTPTFTPTFTPTATPNTSLVISLPVLSATSGSEITVPITVGDTTGLNITSYDLQITFDPAVVVPAATPFDIAGTLSSSMAITVNLKNSGHFIISAFQGSFLAGSGTLINLKFDVVGSGGQTSMLTFEDYTDPGSTIHPGFIFNDGKPTSSTTNGSVSVVTTISGTITYGNPIGTPAPRFVSNVTVTGAGSPAVMTTSGGVGPVEGQYWLSGFGGGAYTVSPTKTGGQNGAINSFDAARIAQHVAGTSFLTGTQTQVADVSNNGSITSFDAARIANYVVGGSQTGITGTWKFSPLNRSYPAVSSSVSGENYLALLMGEVSGNWSNTGARPLDNDEANIIVTVPDQMALTENEVIVPIDVQGVANRGIISCEFEVRYDPAVLQPQENPFDIVGTVGSGLVTVANAGEPGILKIVMYGAMPIEKDGLLLKLKFNAIGSVGSISPLIFERIMFNENEVLTTAGNGLIEASTVIIN
jgi:hypothetical protein